MTEEYRKCDEFGVEGVSSSILFLHFGDAFEYMIGSNPIRKSESTVMNHHAFKPSRASL